MKHFCEQCSKEFKPTRGKQRFCSRTCAALASRGSKHPRGGHTRKKDGYHVIQVDGKNMLEHRHIMEQHIGRKLERKEVVHHIDGNPSNNMIANLLLIINQSEHIKSHCVHYRDDTHKQCTCCKEIKLRSEFSTNGNTHANQDPNYSICKSCRSKKGRDDRLRNVR